jgi:alpha-glucosidase
MGSATGSEDWVFTLNLDFLTKKKIYLATVYEDGENSTIIKRTLRVRRGDSFTVNLKARGGQAIMLEPLAE